jgi:hypothetical protein
MKRTQSHAQNAKMEKTLLELKNEQTAGHQNELLISSRGKLFAPVVRVASTRRETAERTTLNGGPACCWQALTGDAPMRM